MKDLTKDEALEVQDLKFKVLMTDADLRQLRAKLESLVTDLSRKYKAPLDDFQLNTREGTFVKVPKNGNGQKE